MFGSGTARKLFLEVSGTHAKYVYERFGRDLKFCRIDESDERIVIGYACLSVMPSPPTANPISEITKQSQRTIKPH